ncbi:MAG: hypothetical protein D6683_02975 [Actinomyces sp.]|nr:MAG: hypothetical protein D6683_02975 [Actinomyces sp.]
MTALVASVRAVHVANAWLVVIGNGLVGVWAVLAHWRPALRTRLLWLAIALVEAAVAVQVVLGVWMITREDREAAQFHQFYGFVALVTVGLIYSYRAQLAAHRYLLYGGGSLFLMGLAIRAMTISP